MDEKFFKTLAEFKEVSEKIHLALGWLGGSAFAVNYYDDDAIHIIIKVPWKCKDIPIERINEIKDFFKIPVEVAFFEPESFDKYEQYERLIISYKKKGG